MPWALLIDTILWAITLAVSIFLAGLVYRRRDLPARLFLGMVAVLVVPQLHHLIALSVEFLAWLFPRVVNEGTLNVLWALRPLDIAAAVLFGCLILHLFLVFPTESRVIRTWRWIPLLVYVPGVFLAAMMLTHVILGSEGYVTFWGLDRVGLQAPTPQFLFIILTMGMALVRLSVIYLSRATPLVRQQVAWLLWGLLLGGSIVLLTNYLPSILGLPAPAHLVPGLKQVPVLIILGALALSMQRYQLLDVALVVNRSVVYSALVAAITLLYLILATVLGSFFQTLSPEPRPPVVAILTTLIVVLVALPLRDAIQRFVDRLFWRRETDYRQLLQDFSHMLTTPASLSHLLEAIAEQIEEVFHPSGLAIVLAEAENGYRVALSRGHLTSQSPWCTATRLASEHIVPTRLAARRRPLYLPFHVHDVPEWERQEWIEFERMGAVLFVPMHLRTTLVGWVVLGPKLSELSYTGRDLGFLSALVDQSCVALENARLYGGMQQRTTELAMLSLVSSVISSSLDVEYVFEAIVESVMKVMGCDKSAIFELSEDGAELSLRISRGLSQAYIDGSRCIPVYDDNRALAIATCEPLIVIDIQADHRLKGLAERAEQEGYRAVVDVPLIGREGALGILSAYFDRVHTPSASELEVLTTFANQAAIAIENARLYTAMIRERDRAQQLYRQTDAALTQRVEELTSIEEISRQLTSTLNLQQVLDLVLERALQAAQADRGVLSLYEPERRVVQLLAQEGFSAEPERYRTEPWPDDLGVTGRVARTGVSAVVPDVRQDPDYVERAATTRSQISVPIVHNEQVIGIITLESDRLAAFTEEHLRFVQLLAEHAALGMNNARLFEQVTEGRDRLQAILNSTRDAVIVLDTDDRVILVNPRVSDLFGPLAEEWLWSADLSDLARVLESDAFQSVDLDAEGLDGLLHQLQDSPEQVVDIAFSFVNKEQQYYLEGVASPVLSETGEVLGRVIVLRDVTHQQELERFREDLTSMMIHNLQGPLAAMISSLEMLGEEVQFDAEMGAELLRIALGSGRNLYSRIESLLLIRRLEDKQMPLDLQALSLPHVVRPVVDEYAPMATMLGIDLEITFDRDLPAVLVDEEVIGRVLSNLLDNSLKFTPKGGQILVRATMDDDLYDNQVRCTVTDTGVGIAESAKEVIFGMFRRGGQRGRRKGMGIGLYYCKLAVEAHGGRIWVESQEGQGSTFCFTLPAAPDSMVRTTNEPFGHNKV